MDPYRWTVTAVTVLKCNFEFTETEISKYLVKGQL